MNGTREQREEAVARSMAMPHRNFRLVPRYVVFYACIITALTCTNIGLGLYAYLQQRNIESLRAELSQEYRSALATLKEQNRILKAE